MITFGKQLIVWAKTADKVSLYRLVSTQSSNRISGIHLIFLIGFSMRTFSKSVNALGMEQQNAMSYMPDSRRLLDSS